MKKTIVSVMTANPHCIGADIALATAEEQMKKFGVRHLPVLRGGKIVGLLSDRDVKLMNKFSGDFLVEDAMSEDPFVVEPEALFGYVTEVMAERKIGSAIIAEGGKPVGIFTAVDGLKLLAAVYK